MTPHESRLAIDIARALHALDALPLPDDVDADNPRAVLNARALRRHRVQLAAAGLVAVDARPEPIVMPELTPTQRRRLRERFGEPVPVRPPTHCKGDGMHGCGHPPHKGPCGRPLPGMGGRTCACGVVAEVPPCAPQRVLVPTCAVIADVKDR